MTGRQASIASWSHQLCVYISIQADLFPIYLRAISNPTLSRQMTGIQNTSFAHVFMCCATKNAKVTIVALSSLRHLIILHAVMVPLSAIPSTIDLSNNERLHVARCRHTAQDPPDSPLPRHQLPHHSQQTTRKHTRFRSVLPLLFPDGWTSPPSAFQAT